MVSVRGQKTHIYVPHSVLWNTVSSSDMENSAAWQKVKYEGDIQNVSDHIRSVGSHATQKCKAKPNEKTYIGLYTTLFKFYLSLDV